MSEPEKEAVKRDGVSAIIPVLDERESLEVLHGRLTTVLRGLGKDYEVVYIDDGSTDGSWDVLKRVALGDGRVRLVRLRKNFGQTQALAAGFAHARYAIVVTLDADLQNDPADIPRLLATLEDGYDVVSGWRRHRKDRWLTRRLPSQLANGLIRRVSGLPLHDFGCTLKAYRHEILHDLRLYGEMHRSLPVMAAWVGGRIAEIEVAHHARVHGVSKYGILRTYKVLVDLLTMKFMGGFSTRPNHLFGGFGLISLFLGMISLAVVAYRVFALHHLEATPLVFMMIVFFLTGVISIFMGFLAEIIIRGFYDTRGRPVYYVRETVGIERPD